MNPFTELRDATIGWLDIIAAQDGAAARFGQTGRSVANAILFHLVVVIACLLVQALVFGGDWISFWIMVFITMLPLLPLLATTWGSATMLGMRPQPMMAAVTYALAYMWPLRLLGFVVLGTDISIVLVGVLAYLFFRGARVIGGQPAGQAVAYATVAAISLVLVPFALYILSASGPGPA